MLMLKKYCGDVNIWTYPLLPYATISHHFGVPSSPPPPVTSFLNDPEEVSHWFLCLTLTAALHDV